MSELSGNRYSPDYVVPPGEVVQEYMESLGMSQAELSNRTGLVPKTINEIVKAKAPITPETALKLERVLGRPAHFWSNLERVYQDARVRLADRGTLEKQVDWLARVPVSAMAKLGWVERHRDKVRQLEAVLEFFGVASIEQWRTIWEEHQVVYRQSRRFEPHAEAVSAWLRRGEVQGRTIESNPFDKPRFREVLGEIRGLTLEPPERFQIELIRRCASAGVAVVFVPELPKTGLSGATRWLSASKALIQLSLRYKTDDQLWFTFFHEAGHVLLHGKREVFVDGDAVAGGQKEEEANRFAADFLIPVSAWKAFVAAGRPTLESVKAFAAHQGIAPGIIVGRLQHEGVAPFHWGNGLKRRFCWKDPNTKDRQ